MFCITAGLGINNLVLNTLGAPFDFDDIFEPVDVSDAGEIASSAADAAAGVKFIYLLDKLVLILSFDHLCSVSYRVIASGHSGNTQEVAGVPLSAASGLAERGLGIGDTVA